MQPARMEDVRRAVILMGIGLLAIILLLHRNDGRAVAAPTAPPPPIPAVFRPPPVQYVPVVTPAPKPSPRQTPQRTRCRRVVHARWWQIFRRCAARRRGYSVIVHGPWR